MWRNLSPHHTIPARGMPYIADIHPKDLFVTTPALPPAENLLGHEKSPYLRQHAQNPVHWRPWGRVALAEAHALNKPILLSIGYAACHWCHVMAHESFEDGDTAALMNSLFVNIKIDREERPDIDHVYMTALHALGEQGGWPLTMFLTPDGTPFWGGTYFPPEPSYGRPSFRQLITAIARAYNDGDGSVAKNGAALMRALADSNASKPGAAINPQALTRVTQSFLRLEDHTHGGLRGAPKFPNPPIFRLLWQQGVRTTDTAGTAMVHRLLSAMAHGGIHDHLGGGFARYSTDAEWLAPHFEKMLYDNGQILELLAFAQANMPNPLYHEAACGIVAWLTRDMMNAGAFAAAEDADSEGEEGRFYVWTEKQIDAALGDASPAFKTAYDVTLGGNWEGHTILRRVTPRSTNEFETTLAKQRETLRKRRATRIRPARDDKVLADWNGLAITALCRAAFVFARPDWLTIAADVFANVQHLLSPPAAGLDGRTAHAWCDGVITAAGLLDDQASMARAAIALFEATGTATYLAHAITCANAALAHFADPDGSFFTSADDALDAPPVRPRTAADNATPNGNGLIADVFAKLYHLTGDADWRSHAQAVFAAFGANPDQLTAMPSLLAAADLLANATSIVIAGDCASPQGQALLNAAMVLPDPTRLVLRAGAGTTLPAGHPAAGKTPPPGADAAAFICQAGTCSLPVTDAGGLCLGRPTLSPTLSPTLPGT